MQELKVSIDTGYVKCTHCGGYVGLHDTKQYTFINKKIYCIDCVEKMEARKNRQPFEEWDFRKQIRSEYNNAYHLIGLGSCPEPFYRWTRYAVAMLELFNRQYLPKE